MDMQALIDHQIFLGVLYLFVGAILMLIANEWLRPLSEPEFLRGMLLWPVVLLLAVFGFIQQMIRGAIG